MALKLRWFSVEPRCRSAGGPNQGSGIERDLESWVQAAEQKALLRALQDGGSENFAIGSEDFGNSFRCSEAVGAKSVIDVSNICYLCAICSVLYDTHCRDYIYRSGK